MIDVTETKRRDDPADKRFFRASERVFRMNEAWFFAAREGDQGPYASEGEALMEMQRYIETRVQLARFQEEREEAKNNVVELEMMPDDRPILRKPLPVRAQRRVMI